MTTRINDRKLISEELASLFLDHLKKEHNWSEEKIQSVIRREDVEIVPLSVFSAVELSGLELVVKYLHENRGLTYSRIARLLNRDPRTVWNSYMCSVRKKAGPLDVKKSDNDIPLHELKDRSLSMLESIVRFLMMEKGLSLTHIASMLRRDPRTVYTVKRRLEVKLKDGQ